MYTCILIKEKDMPLCILLFELTLMSFHRAAKHYCKVKMRSSLPQITGVP